MSTVVEEATAGVREAGESLRRAEEELRNWRIANQPLNTLPPTYVELKAEVSRCTAVLAGAQQTLQALAVGNTGNSADVISGHSVTMHEYLQTIPRLPTYSTTLPGPSSTRPRHVRHPQLTLHWESFQRDTLNYIETDIIPNINTVETPNFQMAGTIISSEVPSLQMFCSLNLFEIVAKHMGRTVLATERQMVGNPHGHIVVNASQSISAVYEIKGKWVLNPESFEHDRIDMFVGETLVLDAAHNFIRNAVNQMYTYMVWNHLQFGILSSFDFTFFLKRVRVENAVDGFEQLFISSGIAHNTTNPTVLQSIAYFLSLADGIPFTSPPPSALTTVLTSDDEHDSAPIQEDSSAFNESDFAFEDFHIKSILGYGRTKVYYDAKNDLALKAIDLWKQLDMLAELQHEVQIYQMLSDLQGKSIPRLVSYGYWEGGLYCIVFSLCGSVPDALSESQKQSVLSTLETIHQRGIIHNDIKKENLLVDENGTVYLIDFGFATLDSCHERQQNERLKLLQCISYL